MIKKMLSSEHFRVWEGIQYKVTDREISLGSIQKMVDEGLDVNCEEEKGGITPLFLFSTGGDSALDVCRLLIKNGANPKHLIRNNRSVLNLNMSSGCWDSNSAVFFLERGLDPNQKNSYGYSSLASLVDMETREVPDDNESPYDMACILLAYGAKVDKNMLEMASPEMRYVLMHEKESREKGKEIIEEILDFLDDDDRNFERWSKNWKKVKSLRKEKIADASRQEIVSLLDSLNAEKATPFRKIAKETAVKTWAKKNPKKSKYMIRKEKKRQSIVSLLDTLNQQPPTLIRKAAKEATVRAYRSKNPKER